MNLLSYTFGNTAYTTLVLKQLHHNKNSFWKMNNDQILLWEGLRGGSEKDFHSLYVLYYNDMFRYGYYLTSDVEVAKENINLVFLNLWDKRKKLPEVKNPKAYIISSYKNQVFLQQRKSGNLSVIYVGNSAFYNSLNVSSPEEAVIDKQEYEILKKKLKRILSSLSERQQQLIELRFINEMSYDEIAEHLNISLRTVYNSIHESLKLLRTTTSKKEFSLLSFLVF